MAREVNRVHSGAGPAAARRLFCDVAIKGLMLGGLFSAALPPLAGCQALKALPEPRRYRLLAADAPGCDGGAASAATPPVLAIARPRVAGGLDRRSLAWRPAAGELGFYAHSEWVTSPALELERELLAQLAGCPGLIVVPLAQGTVADWRLEGDLLDFSLWPQGVGSAASASFVFEGLFTLVRARSGQVAGSLRLREAALLAGEIGPEAAVAAAGRAWGQVLQRLQPWLLERVQHPG